MKREFYISILALISVIVFIDLIFHLTSIKHNNHSNFKMVVNVNQNSREKNIQILKQEARKLKVLCLVMTIDSSENRAKSKAIRETWGRRCDKLIFVQNGTLSRNKTYLHSSDIIAVPLKFDDRTQLWHKIIEAFTHLHNQYLDDYDWFMKTDDDAYVILDSLREFLFLKSSPKEPIYFGYKFKPYVKQGYMSGGPGYVLSRSSLKSLVEDGFVKNKTECNLERGQVEDVEIGKCLESTGVKAGDTRDTKARPKFLPLSPIELISGPPIDKDQWFYHYAFYDPPQVGRELCCSDEPISFHYIEPKMMYFIDWLLYDVKSNSKNNNNNSNE